MVHVGDVISNDVGPDCTTHPVSVIENPVALKVTSDPVAPLLGVRTKLGRTRTVNTEVVLSPKFPFTVTA